MATGFIVQAVDSTMVAPMGTSPLAALGVAAVSCFIPVSITMGLITVVQKRVASTESTEVRNRALSGNILLGAMLAIPLAMIYFLFAKKIASIYCSGETAQLATSYIKVFCPSFVFSSMNQALNGYWIGLFKSKTRLSITLAITAVNVLGNLLLSPIFGLRGVAMASAIAIAFGFALNLYLTRRLEGYRWLKPRLNEMHEDLGIVFGVTLHQVSLALTLNAAEAIVGLIGVDALAIANVVGTLSLPALYLGIGYGVATGSFLIKTLNENDYLEARRVGAMALTQVALISLALGALVLIFSSPIRHWFFKEQEVFAMAEMPLRMLALLFLIDGVGCVLQRFHFVSDGIKKSFMVMTVVQWGLFIPGAYAAVKWGGIGYPEYLALHLAQRALIGIVLYLVWVVRAPLPKKNILECRA